MWFSFGRISLLFCAIWISVCRADDIVMQLFANRPINYVSDKYISFSMSPADLVDIYNDKRFYFEVVINTNSCSCRLYTLQKCIHVEDARIGTITFENFWPFDESVGDEYSSHGNERVQN